MTQEQLHSQVQAARDQMQAQMHAASAHSDTQLASANAQILYFSQMLESVRADQERLRRESEAAFNSFESRTQGRTAGTREREICFVNMKSFEGWKFAGGKAESFQAWAKRVRIFCDAPSSGMKKAMETAEASTREVDVRSLGLADPRLAEELDAKLHDFLSTYVAEEVPRIVRGIPGKGFEAWRQMKICYQPEDGLMHLFSTKGLFSRKTCSC